MGLFSFLKPGGARRYISSKENERIKAAIQEAERQTSGEVRVFFETRCQQANPLDRAAEIFFGLKMDQTDQRNGVLVYVAFKDHRFAIFADEGIYREMGADYWQQEASKIVEEFSSQHFADGLVKVIGDIGQALQQHFPYDQKGDKNELPDDIVFGS